MNIRPSIQEMSQPDVDEMIQSFMGPVPPRDPSDREFLLELLEQQRLLALPLRVWKESEALLEKEVHYGWNVNKVAEN